MNPKNYFSRILLSVNLYVVVLVVITGIHREAGI